MSYVCYASEGGIRMAAHVSHSTIEMSEVNNLILLT